MKTKTIFSTVVLIGTFLSAKCQTNTTPPPAGNSSAPTGYAIAISLGGATPLGSISDRANFGGHFDLLSEIPIAHSHFGIAIMLGGQANGYNTQAFVNSASSSDITSATANSFVSDNLLVGGFATIPVHRFSFDFRLMFGSMVCEYPNITAYDYAGDIYQYTFPNTVKVFSEALGAGVRYNLSKKLTLMLNWNYISGGEATFNGNVSVAGYYTGYYSTPVSITKQFSEFTAAWGLGWIL